MAKKRGDLTVKPVRGDLARVKLLERGTGPEVMTRTVSLSEIKPRVSADTRALDAEHVLALAESIHALGLLEPIVVDRNLHLLAGGHRLAACWLLSSDQEGRGAQLLGLCAETRERVTPAQMERAQQLDEGTGALDVDRVPVRLMAFDSGVDFDQALQVEAVENEKRRDYTRREIKALHARLIERGFTDRDGRPRAGEKSAKRTLALVIGKSLSTVKRALRDSGSKTGSGDPVSPEVKARAAEQRDREALIKAADRYLERHAKDSALGAHTLKVLRKALEALKGLD